MEYIEASAQGTLEVDVLPRLQQPGRHNFAITLILPQRHGEPHNGCQVRGYFKNSNDAHGCGRELAKDLTRFSVGRLS